MEKRLYRSRQNRMIFGVCGGLGEYAGIDPTVIRLGMIFLGFTGFGIVFYIAAGLIMPEAPMGGRAYSGPRRDREDFEPVAGAKPEAPEAQTEKAPQKDAVKPEPTPASDADAMDKLSNKPDKEV